MNINKRALLAFVACVALTSCGRGQSDAPTLDTNAAPTPVAAQPAVPPKPPAAKPLAEVPSWVGTLKATDTLACYVDKVNDEGGAAQGQHRTFKTGEGFALMGWAVDKMLPPGSEQPPVLVLLKGDTGSYAYTATRHDRPDVSTSALFAEVQPKKVGVMLDAVLSGVAPGNYQIQYVVGSDASGKLCDLGAPWNVVVTE